MKPSRLVPTKPALLSTIRRGHSFLVSDGWIGPVSYQQLDDFLCASFVIRQPHERRIAVVDGLRKIGLLVQDFTQALDVSYPGEAAFRNVTCFGRGPLTRPARTDVLFVGWRFLRHCDACTLSGRSVPRPLARKSIETQSPATGPAARGTGRRGLS
jgi:hypothetical protein